MTHRPPMSRIGMLTARARNTSVTGVRWGRGCGRRLCRRFWRDSALFMGLSVRTLAAGLMFCVLTTASAAADERVASTAPSKEGYLGVQGLVVVGDHGDIAGKQYGVGGAALFQVNLAPIRRISLHAEGVPVVSIPQKASAFYGQAAPAIGVFDTAVRFAVDKAGRYRVGVGTTVINQRTPLPNISQVAYSRLAGGRYEVLARIPRGKSRFIEAQVGVTPRLFGTDHFLFSDGNPAVNKNERAAEEDGSIVYGIRRAHSEVVFGLRSINFSAVFTKDGSAADRNNGAGIMIEFRRDL